MAADKKQDDKKKPKAQSKAPKPEAAPKKEKKAKEAAPTAEAPQPKKEEAPRPPADPRMKVFKKFQGKFLPKGTLRDRHRELLTRWNSGEDHGGVTVEELKSLLDDWRKSRAKPAKAKA